MPRCHPRAPVFAACVAVTVAVAVAATGAAAATSYSLVSVPEDPLIHGIQGDGAAINCDLSGDGDIVVFESDARQLDAADDNAKRDVFVRDRVAGTLSALRPGGGNALPVEGTATPKISANGRWIGFTSRDASLAGGAVDGTQAYLYDRQAGTLVLASRTPAGAPGSDGSAFVAAVSSAGRYLLFQSSQVDLVAADTNGANDIFLFDADTGTVTRVSTDAAGAEANGASSAQAFIANDGSRVAFESDATNLVAGDTNGVRDVFVKVIATGAIQRVSVSNGGAQLDEGSDVEGLSGDGRAILFTTTTDNVVAGDTDGFADLFVRRLAGAGSSTIRASVDAAGNGGGAHARGGDLSASGDIAIVESSSTTWVPGFPGAHLFRKDLVTGALDLLTPAATATFVRASAISGDGGTACYDSDGFDIVIGDRNREDDVFVADTAGNNTLASAAATPLPMTVGDAYAAQPDVDGSGRFVVFASESLHLDPPVTFGFRSGTQVYLRDRVAGTVQRLTRATGAPIGDDFSDGSVEHPAISANGRFVAFLSTADDLVLPPLGVGDSRVYRVDRDTGATTRVTTAETAAPRVANDGTVVFGTKQAIDAADGNVLEDVYRAATGTPVRVSRSTTGGDADGPSHDADIAAGGSVVVFVSSATNLVSPAVAGGDDQVYAHDVAAGTTTLVSRARTGGGAGDDDSYGARVSSDGRHVAFLSRADNLVAGDANGATDVFVFARDTGTMTRISAGLDGTGLLAAGSYGARIAPGGAHVAFDAYDDGDEKPHLVRWTRTGNALAVMFDGNAWGDTASIAAFAIADDGTLVFDQAARLLPADDQRDLDVYAATGTGDSPSVLFADGFE